MNSTIVPAADKDVKRNNVFMILIAAISIYSMIIPIVIMDISIAIYQFIYFSIMEIPKLNRSDFVVIDRGKLSKLSFLQKLNCVYCGYGNGVLAWSKAIAQQTELYSCAIKHGRIPKEQANQKYYYDYSEFE